MNASKISQSYFVNGKNKLPNETILKAKETSINLLNMTHFFLFFHSIW